MESISFDDILANIEAQSIPLENETALASTDQSQTQTISSDSPSGNPLSSGSGGNSQYAGFQVINSRQSLVSSSSVTASLQTQGDAYCGVAGNSNSQPANPESDDADDRSVAASSQPSDDKPVEKDRPHKVSSAENASSNSQSSVTNTTATAQPTSTSVEATPTSSSASSVEYALPASDHAETPHQRSSKGSNSGTDLAFAVRVQGQSSNAAETSFASLLTASDPGSPTTSASTNNASTFAGQLASMLPTSVGRPTLSTETPSDGDSVAAASTSVSGMSGTYPADGETAETETAEDVAPAPVTDEPVQVAQPVKTIQVQITGANDERVDLKLMEKSGTLTMSVRSADGSLNKALQQNLPELSTKLSDQQIRAEWWRSDAQPTSAQSSGTSSSGGSSSSNQQEQTDQNNNQSGGQGRRGAPAPDWLEELSSPRQNNQNGAQYSWHL